MNYDRGFGFIGGLVLGAVVGAAAALLLAPSSGEDTRELIRSEGFALKQRGQDFSDDRMHEAQQMVKQGQKDVSNARARMDSAMQDQKDHLQETIDASKQAASQRKEEMLNRFDDAKAQANN